MSWWCEMKERESILTISTLSMERERWSELTVFTWFSFSVVDFASSRRQSFFLLSLTEVPLCPLFFFHCQWQSLTIIISSPDTGCYEKRKEADREKDRKTRKRILSQITEIQLNVPKRDEKRFGLSSFLSGYYAVLHVWEFLFLILTSRTSGKRERPSSSTTPLRKRRRKKEQFVNIRKHC